MRGRCAVAKHKQTFDDEYVALQECVAREGDVPGPEVYERYLEALGIQTGDAVLDLGVGYGRLLPSIRSYTSNVTGADLSERMLRRAREYDPDARVALGDACLLPFAAGSFDQVTCWAVWENIPDPGRAISEVQRVLRPGGQWLVSGKNLMNWNSVKVA
ncbi:MAG: class I SAM-dependent methyltransferase, partial [Armatimonadota bacterium]